MTIAALIAIAQNNHALQVGDRVVSQAFGQGYITSLAGVANVRVRFGKGKARLMRASFLSLAVQQRPCRAPRKRVRRATVKRPRYTPPKPVVASVVTAATVLAWRLYLTNHNFRWWRCATQSGSGALAA